MGCLQRWPRFRTQSREGAPRYLTRGQVASRLDARPFGGDMLGEQSQTAPRGFGSRRLMALKRMVVERASVLQRPRLDGGGPRSASYVRTKYVTIPNRIVYSRTNQVLIDGGLVATALCIAYLFRFDGE